MRVQDVQPVRIGPCTGRDELRVERQRGDELRAVGQVGADRFDRRCLVAGAEFRIGRGAFTVQGRTGEDLPERAPHVVRLAPGEHVHVQVAQALVQFRVRPQKARPVELNDEGPAEVAAVARELVARLAPVVQVDAPPSMRASGGGRDCMCKP